MPRENQALLRLAIELPPPRRLPARPLQRHQNRQTIGLTWPQCAPNPNDKSLQPLRLPWKSSFVTTLTSNHKSFVPEVSISALVVRLECRVRTTCGGGWLTWQIR